MIAPLQRPRWRRRPAVVPGRVRARAHAGGGAALEILTRAEIAAIVVLAATPFVFHWLYGALVSEIALLLVATQSILLGRDRGCSAPAPRLANAAEPRPGRRSLHRGAGDCGVVIDSERRRGHRQRLVFGGGVAPWGTLDCSATLIEMIKLMGLAGAFVAAAAIGHARKRLSLALRLIVYFGAAFALLSIVLSSADAIYATQGRRVEARFLNPNTAGVVFGALSLLALAMIWRRLSSRRARLKPVSLALDVASFAILASALLSTLSRGALAGNAFRRSYSSRLGTAGSQPCRLEMAAFSLRGSPGRMCSRGGHRGLGVSGSGRAASVRNPRRCSNALIDRRRALARDRPFALVRLRPRHIRNRQHVAVHAGHLPDAVEHPGGSERLYPMAGTGQAGLEAFACSPVSRPFVAGPIRLALRWRTSGLARPGAACRGPGAGASWAG